jgi:L-rhamnose mutarotase
MRLALHSVLVTGAEADYRREHSRIPAELAAVFGRAGIHDWTIWRSGTDLFHLVECDDWDAAMQIVQADPADARWQAHIGRFVASFRGPDGEEGDAPAEQVWSLTEQLSQDG